MELELKHLVPYLPYELKVFHSGNVVLPMTIHEQLNSMDDGFSIKETIELHYIKPILRPLNEYKDIPEIMENFSVYAEEEFINGFGFGKAGIDRFNHISYEMANLMFKYHLDLFFLIDDNLAKNINNINNARNTNNT